jgi:Zn-dependent protease
MRSGTASFRPVPAPVGKALLLGAVGGAGLGLLLGLPSSAFLLFMAFGAVAAWVAVAASHASGLRAIADARGLRVVVPRGAAAAGLDGAWPELRVGFGFARRADGGVQRYAILADARGRSFAFADLAGAPTCEPVAGADGRAVPVVDLREAALLLGLVVQRCPAWHVLPEPLASAAAGVWGGAAPPTSTPPSLPAIPTPARHATGSPQRSARVGVLALIAKLGSKLLAGLGKVGGTAVKAVKTTNVGWAAASAASYSLLWNWKVALALMLQLFVHEYGHVHAMRRTGMRVRGMYFIPFLGAMAVTEDQFTSRRQQAYVALNGPLWGSALILLPAALYLWTEEPIFAAVASLWALINLFNLLPIAPLDGGRVMQAFALSFSSGLGLAVSVLGLFALVALGTQLGFSLVWLLAALGAMELLSEAQARTGARALRLLPEAARFGPAHWLYLRAVLGPPPGSPTEPVFLHGLERAERAAHAEPLRPGEMVRWGLAYAGLAVALVLLVWLLRHVPGAGVAATILE